MFGGWAPGYQIQNETSDPAAVESHGSQGVVERTIRELKTILLTEKKIPRLVPAIIKTAWLRSVEDRLNVRAPMYVGEVPVTPLSLHLRELPTE
eukprot:3162299-Prorocentrum_lima.AAC.1